MDNHEQLCHTRDMISCQLSRSKIIQSVASCPILRRLRAAAGRQRISYFGGSGAGS